MRLTQTPQCSQLIAIDCVSPSRPAFIDEYLVRIILLSSEGADVGYRGPSKGTMYRIVLRIKTKESATPFAVLE